VLIVIYEFLKTIFMNEYNVIAQKNISLTDIQNLNKDKKKKIRRKNIVVSIVKPVL
jgi:hypothetical protein